MSLSTPAISASANESDGHIVDDLACAECGYNLRTLATDAKCPECGMAVGISMRADRLSDAPTDWLNTLASGAWWLRLSVILACPIFYLGAAISGLGVWRLTAVQPGRVEPSLDRGYRVLGRWATLIGSAVITLMTFGVAFYVAATDKRLTGNFNLQLNTSSGAVPISELPMLDTIYLIGHAIYVLGLLSVWRYLQVLAERVPEPELARAWQGLGRSWLATVFGLAGVSGAVFLLVRTGIIPGGSTSVLIPIVVGLIFAVALLALWLKTLRTVTRMSEVLKAPGSTPT